MATASHVQLSATQQPEYYRPGISTESSKLASDLLQENHEIHHVFFNRDGYHNHIAHHLLSIWALKASPAEIGRAYESNKSYQRGPMPVETSIVSDMSDAEKFEKFLGDDKYYHDFLVFFQQEMKATSWQEVVQKYIFAGDKRADDMLVRLFSGFLHPIIHLGFGVEFQQPAIIAEALAQAAIHNVWIGKFLLPAEQVARHQSGKSSKTIVQLLDEIHADKELSMAPRWSDGNKVRDGVIGRAGERMLCHAAQYHVKPSELGIKLAEQTNAVAYYTAGAQRSEHIPKYDFYYIHCLNCSIFLSAFMKQDWLSEANKIRLLEWKVRNDLAMYASRRSPDVRMDLVRQYKPKRPSDGWDEIEDRVCKFDDDGHASKLIRALAHGQQICQPYETEDSFRVKHDDWLQMAHMAIDSVEAGMPHWVRSAGFDEAWEHVPKAQL